MKDLVVLVDENDLEIGFLEKMEAHQKGMLHRAFSVLIVNSKNEVLLQKRADSKYHSAGLWTNTCCSHPRPNELMIEAVTRRLHEEMGIDLKPNFAYKFLYQTELENNLIEHELDYVFIGSSDDQPIINKQEVSDWKYLSIPEIRKDVVKNPNHYTFWFKEILNNPDLENYLPR